MSNTKGMLLLILLMWNLGLPEEDFGRGTTMTGEEPWSKLVEDMASTMGHQWMKNKRGNRWVVRWRCRVVRARNDVWKGEWREGWLTAARRGWAAHEWLKKGSEGAEAGCWWRWKERRQLEARRALECEAICKREEVHNYQTQGGEVWIIETRDIQANNWLNSRRIIPILSYMYVCIYVYTYICDMYVYMYMYICIYIPLWKNLVRSLSIAYDVWQ